MCLARLVFCQHASKSLLGVLCAVLIGIGFFISLNVRRISSARGNSLPGVQMCEATEMIVFSSYKLTDGII